MKLVSRYKLLAAAILGLAFAAATANAQLALNVHSQAFFGPFTGGTFNGVTNNNSIDTAEVITTGTPVATPFNITYNPFVGPTNVNLGTGTLTSSTFTFNSPVTPLNYFTQLGTSISYDFDNNGVVDLVQAYTINLAPFSANGLTGVSYTIIPVNFFGSVMINGTLYNYASVVANSVGTLFDGSTTTASIQFQFITAPVPEPSTYGILGALALGGVVMLRRRRARATA